MYSSSRFSAPNSHQAYNFRLDEIEEENEPQSPRRGSREDYAGNASNARKAGSMRSPPLGSANAARSSNASPKYPVVERSQIRTRCKDIMQEKSAKIFIDRLEKEGYLRWSTLNKLEKRLVDYNPAFFQLSIDLPDFVEPRVRMIRTPHPEQVDVTGNKGGLRTAIDEDFAWLPDAKFTFDVRKSSFRECAIMAFTPPRCFIMCDEVGTEGEERVDSISDNLRAFYSKSSIQEDSIDVRPGVALVGLRGETFLRIVVLEADVHIRTKVRCSCMDRNAIYSFDRDELFPLPDEFSAQKVPVNIFLARFRGTHFVYKEKYDEVIEGLCQPNKDEGLVAFVTCAMYGPAPDGLIIIDATMPSGGWVSSVLVRSGIVAALAGDPNIVCSSEQAEQAIKSKHEKEMLSNNVIREEVSDDQKNEGMYESGGDTAESVKSECNVSVNETVKPDETSQKELKYDKQLYEASKNGKVGEIVAPDEALMLAKKQEEMREEFEKMREEVLSGSSNASSIYEIHASTSGVGHPEDEVKIERESSAVETAPPCADYERDEVKSEHSQDEGHDIAEEKPPKCISPTVEKSAETIAKEETIKKEETNDEEQIEQLEAKMQDLKASEELGSEAQEVEEAPEVEYSQHEHPSSSDGETVEETIDDELELKSALDAYLSVRRLSKESLRFKAAMDASILSAINCASGIFVSKMVDDGRCEEEDLNAQRRSRSELEFVKMIQTLGQKPKN